MIKVYEVNRFDGLQLALNWLGQTVHVEFKGGDARHRAKLVTSNLFVQDALEHDARFGKLYLLTKKYNDTPKAKAKAAEKGKKQITRVKNVNDAMRWFAENGFTLTGEVDIDSMAEKAGVEFPNLKR